MEIRNNNIHFVPNVDVQKKDKTNPSNLQEMKDISNCPNPTEYLGRSQVVFRGKTGDNTQPTKKLPQIPKKDLHPIKLKESPLISKDDMVKTLNEMGYTPEEIAQVDFSDEKIIKGISGLKTYLEMDEIKKNKEELLSSFREQSSEEKLNFLQDDMPEYVLYLNQDNYDNFERYVDMDIDDFMSICSEITDTEDKEGLLSIIPLSYMVGGKLSINTIRDLHWADPEKVSYERADILRRINERLPEDKNLPIAQCSNLGADKDLSPENVNEYLGILERYGQKKFFNIESLLPMYQGKNLKEITEDVRQVDNILEKYPIDFTQTEKDSKYSITDLQRILGRKDIEDVQKYINSLTPEAKSTGISNIPKEDSKIDNQKLAQICNIISEEDYGRVSQSNLFEFIYNQEENNYENLDGIIQLISRYKGTGLLNTSYMDRAFTVGKNDYTEAIKALDLKDEIDNKKLELSGYSFFDALHNPDVDLKNMNKILTYIRDNDINGHSYPDCLLSDANGYNKFILNHKIGRYFSYDRKAELYSLAEMLNNEEEANYAIDLLEQKRFPNKEDYYEYRFGWDLNTIKELMQSYQNDKEATTTIVGMKNKDNDWRITSKESIMPTIEAYQLDKETTLDVLNLTNEHGYDRFYNGETIKSIVETAQIDKNYTFEIINKKNTIGNTKRNPYRFSDAEKIKNIVTAGQIDKEFTNYLLDLTHIDDYDIERYRIYDTKDYIYFAEKASSGDKDFITSLFEMKSDRGDGKNPRLNTETIKAILENPPENREFLMEQINEPSKYGGSKYNTYDIEQFAKSTKIDKDLTEQLLNETYLVNDHEYKRFDRPDKIFDVISASQINKELTEILLKETLTDWNEQVYPRFDGEEIKRIVDLTKEYDKQDIINLVNMKDAKYNGSTTARFKESEIRSVLDSMSKDRELTETLLAKTVKWNSESIEHPKYGAYDIKNIVDATQIDKEFALSILNDAEIKRGSDDILYITEASKVNKDLARKFHKMIYVDKDGDIEKRFNGYEIKNLVSDNSTNEFALEQAEKTVTINGKEYPRFYYDDICQLISSNKNSAEFTKFLIERTIKDKNDNTIPVFSADQINYLTSNVTLDQFKELEKQIGENINNYTFRDVLTAVNFPEFYGTKSINEIPIAKKKSFLKSLVSCNADMFQTSEYIKKDFPLIPTTADEYCSLLPSVVRSLGIETDELSDEDINEFNKNLENLTEKLSDLSDDDFNKLEIHQEYPSEKFIKDVLEKLETSNLSKIDKQRVFDYYGFELHPNPNNPTGYSIVGYPVNLNNGAKLAQIDNPNTKKVVEELRKNVKEFSENNKIKSNNSTIQKELNEICKALPEIHKTIGKKDDSLHEFDTIKNSLKVLQKLAQNNEYQGLNESDKKIMQLAALMHNIAKAEGCEDKMNAKESSFDTYFIAKKFKLSKDEEIKLYTLIKNHDWIENTESLTSNDNSKELQSIAFDLQQNNNFDMTKIFAEANIETLSSESSKQANKEIIENSTPKIKEYIHELKKSQPLLPVTKMPKASTIEKNITQVNPDGSTNIKGVYKDASGLVVVKFNEVENWEELGLPAGTKSRGIKAKGIENINGKQEERKTETGNIKFFVHGLDYANQLAKFDAFSLADSEVLLSVSYAERPETKYRFFRPQGIMLDVPSDYVYGGGNTDSGSGCGKFIDNFKSSYVFGGHRESDRKYISELIKEETGMSDEEYIKFVEKNKDKAMHEIEPKELQEKIVQKLATINSNHRKGNRAYNEMYISNPRDIMGVFAYNMNDGENIEEPLKFLEEQNGRTEFLKKYALEHDVPFYVFGD